MAKQRTNKLRLGLVYGGPSLEHNVSVWSAKQIKKFLDKDKYRIVEVKISKTGQWPTGLDAKNLFHKIDLAFIAMHGAYGEDGTIQAILESCRIPYTGSKVLASALAMDKWRSSLLAIQSGLTVPLSVLYNANIALSEFGKRLVLKPNTGGSTVGVKIIDKKNFLKTLKTFSKKEKESLLVQEYVAGLEVTVGVLGNEYPHALPVIEILPKAEFYDFNSKYNTGGSEHIIPARISKKLQAQLQTAAVIMHQVIGCRGMSRSDFIISPDGIVYYLETNTIPGMTSTSLLPQAAASVGINFPRLLDMIIDFSK